MLVQTVPHCSKGSASSPSVEPVTQNVRTNSHMILSTPRPLIVLTQHSSCHVPPIFRTAKLPERTGSSLTKYQESPQTARLTCSKVGQRACSRSGQTWEEACPASFLPLFSPPCSHSPPCKTHDSVPVLGVTKRVHRLEKRKKFRHLLPGLLQSESCCGEKVKLWSRNSLLPLNVIIILLPGETQLKSIPIQIL